MLLYRRYDRSRKKLRVALYVYIYNKAGEKKRRRWLNGEIDRVCLYYIIA